MIRRDAERGQTMVEFAIICTLLIMLTVGLVDTGRAFFQYNAIAAAARYGARWAGVVGGTCSTISSQDELFGWCSKEAAPIGEFWSLQGNKPQQAANYVCPDTGGDAGCCPNSGTVSGFPYYIIAPIYTGGSETTIVGAIAHKFDTNGSSDHFVTGGLAPGLDLSNVKVCIQLPTYVSHGTTMFEAQPGDKVIVKVYTTFRPVSTTISSAQFPIVASSEYTIE